MPMAPKRHNARGETAKRADDTRKSAYQRGYDKPWAKIAADFIDAQFTAGNYYCACGCKKNLLGRERRDIHVDHKKPHSGRDDPLYRDVNNLQLLYYRCHSRKTVKHDGGFGR